MVRRSNKFLHKSKPNFRHTTHPDVMCTELVSFIRAKTSNLFEVQVKNNLVPENTVVIIKAGLNEGNDAVMKNNQSMIRANGLATFNDLRFMSVSGRGKFFDVSIVLQTQATGEIVAVYKSAIKVTVDGPRPCRKNAAKHESAGMLSDGCRAYKTKKISLKLAEATNSNRYSSSIPVEWRHMPYKKQLKLKYNLETSRQEFGFELTRSRMHLSPARSYSSQSSSSYYSCSSSPEPSVFAYQEGFNNGLNVDFSYYLHCISQEMSRMSSSR